MNRSAASSSVLRCQLSRLAALAVAALLLAMLGFPSLSAFPAFFVEDDAWFYLQIGYHLGTLGRSTFDGIHTTSGYHLGWAGLLGLTAAATAIVSASKQLFLLVAIAVYFFLALITVECFGRTLIEKAALLFFVFYPGLFMESQLLALLLLAVVHFFLAGKKSPWADAAMALVPLVRVDATVMLAPLAAYHLCRRDWERFGKACLFTGLGLALHFGLMLAAFGRLASVSSLLKSDWSSQMGMAQIARLNVERFGRSELAVFVVLLGMALVAAWALWRREKRVQGSGSGAGCRRTFDGEALKVLAVVAGPAAFVLIHAAVNPVMRTWYFSPALFVLALVLMRVSETDGATFAGRRCETEAGKPGQSPARRSAAPPLSWAADPRSLRKAFLVLVCLLAVRETRNAYYFILDDAATLRAERTALFLDDVRRIVPPGEPIFQVDGAGYTGFFAGRPIVNGDGLMNDYDYLERLKADGLADYLRENRIRYVITNSPIQGPEIIRQHGLVLEREDVDNMAESGVCEPYRAFVLWRVRESYFAAEAREEPTE